MKNDVLEELYIKYYNDALFYTYSLCHDKNLAEDITQDAFYKALTSVDKKIDNFKYWLLCVCKNEYFDYIKKKKPELKEDIDLCDEEDLMLNKLIKEERYRSLYRAIELLEPLDKEIILLFYFENMKIRDIAKIINKSENTTKVSLARARNRLKQILEV